VQADDPKEAAKGILARAAARGIIAGVQEKLTAVQEHSVKKQGQRKDAKRKSKKTAKLNDANPTKPLSSVGSTSERLLYVESQPGLPCTNGDNRSSS